MQSYIDLRDLAQIKIMIKDCVIDNYRFMYHKSNLPENSYGPDMHALWPCPLKYYTVSRPWLNFRFLTAILCEVSSESKQWKLKPGQFWLKYTEPTWRYDPGQGHAPCLRQLYHPIVTYLHEVGLHVHCDLDLGDVIFCRGYDKSLGYGQQLCEVSSRSNLPRKV